MRPPRLFSRSLERRRSRAAADAVGSLARYYNEPIPADATPAPQLPLLAVDLESTSLELDDAAILSIGFVPVHDGRVRLGAGRRIVVDPGRDVGQSALVHGLTDDVVAAEGVDLGEAMPHLLRACAGRVLLAHYARIEHTLLSRACQELYRAPFEPPIIDTLRLQRRVLGRTRLDPETSGLNLWEAREHYGLPRYGAHDALTDAIACAELFLAQVAEWSAATAPDLQELRDY